MNKFIFNDYFHEPQGKIAKRMLFKSDNVIAFLLNIASVSKVVCLLEKKQPDVFCPF